MILYVSSSDGDGYDKLAVPTVQLQPPKLFNTTPPCH